MRKQDLVTQLSRLTEDAELGVLIGDQFVGISGVVAVGSDFALTCLPADVRDVLAEEWGIARKRASEIAFSQPDEPQENDAVD